MKEIVRIISCILVNFVLFHPILSYALTKTETVYSNLDSTGKPIKSVVNNQLTGITKGDVIDDTELKEILNINGDEKFNQNNQRLIWESTGKDIFYQGTTTKNNPITISVKYFLNNKESRVEDIIGKKGNIKMKLTFTNNSYVETKKLYTPFVMVVGMMLDSKNNSNIKVNTGKAINTGSKNIVLALSAPALYDDLRLKEFKDLDKIAITYDTTKFSLSNIYMVATPKLLEEKDLEVFDKVNGLSKSINTIQENMDKIENGTKELVEGSKKITTGSLEISTNLKKVLNPLLKLEDASSSLDSKLRQASDLLNQAQEILSDKDVSGSITNLLELKSQNNNVLANLANTNNSLNNTYTNYQLGNFQTEEELVTYFKEQGITDTVIKDLVIVKKTIEDNTRLITLLNANNIAIDNMISILTDISTQISALLMELDKMLNQVEDDVSKLSSGITRIKAGIDKVYDGSVKLKNGSHALNDGNTTLYNGISILNKRGINVLTASVNKINSYSIQTKELAKLSRNYNGYASSNADKTVFIYKIASIK